MTIYRRAFLILRYFTINVIFVASIYFGLILGLNGPANIALFLGWLTAILGTITFIALSLDKDNKLTEYYARQEPSVIYYWIDVVIDLVVLAAFIWTGHYVLAVFFGIQMMVVKAVRDIPKNMALKTLQGK